MPKRLTQEEVSAIFKAKNCELVSQYVNSSIPVEYKCPQHDEIAKIRIGDFKKGRNACPQCKNQYRKNLGISQRRSYEDVKAYFLSRNCELLSTEYHNATSPLSYKCLVHGQECITTWNWFSSGGATSCSECHKEHYKKLGDQSRHSIEDVRAYFASKNCELLSSEYKNANYSLLEYKCLEHDQVCQIRYANFKNKDQTACTYCSTNRSENLVRKMLEELTGKKWPRVRPNWLKNPKTGCNLELDGWCEELNIGFERQGIQHEIENEFFHRSKDAFTSQQERDNLKLTLAEAANKQFIVIPSKLSYRTPKKMKNFLLSELRSRTIPLVSEDGDK